ncbi:MAG: twin-arginine translocase TatA/TatE family subunit [Chloroflexota bacterium]|nr:MAG: twin-arginine translocase TatA/TatE family subunit [Chloroflexota bacterium]
MPDLVLVLLVILIVVVIWRGPKTLPQIGAMLGRGVKAAREEANQIRTDRTDRDDRGSGDDADKPPAP